MGIMGHNLCLDTFGPPSIEEAEAGLTTHGESSIVRYEIERGSEHLKMSAQLPLAGLSFQRNLALDGEIVVFNESVYNLGATDRPIAWTQHVTLGPSFLTAKPIFPCRKIQYLRNEAFDEGVMASASDFTWPMSRFQMEECRPSHLC